MIVRDEVDELLDFLSGLEIHEAWLSEAKPCVPGFWESARVITEEERLKLVALQDQLNRKTGITVNYLGHFEGREHFGCNAGHKMVYVDSYGEVSPCVFLPLTFGNVMERPAGEIFARISGISPPRRAASSIRTIRFCRNTASGGLPLGPAEGCGI